MSAPFVYHGVGSVKINNRLIFSISHFKSRSFLMSFFFCFIIFCFFSYYFISVIIDHLKLVEGEEYVLALLVLFLCVIVKCMDDFIIVRLYLMPDNTRYAFRSFLDGLIV